MRALIFAALLLVGGCHKAAAPVAVDTADVDALWKLAPADAIVGVVASPRAVALVDHAWQDVHAYLKAVPELAAIDRLLGDGLASLAGTSVATLADLGLAPAHGAALFVTRGGGSVAIVPVGDRDKLLAVVHGTRGADVDTLPHGTCKLIGELYACASAPALLAAIGTGSGSGASELRAKLDVVGARGEIEAVALALPLQPSGPIDLAGVAQLARGAVTLRLAATGVSPTTTASLGAPAHVRADGDRSAGFVMLNLSRMLAKMPPTPVLPGVTLADLAHSIADPLTVAVATGPLAFDLRLPLADPAPMTAAIAHCRDFPALALMGATVDGNVCHVPIMTTGVTVDAAVEGNELRIGKRLTTGAPASVPLTAVGDELEAGTWQLAVWGRGTVFAPLAAQGPTVTLPDQLRMIVRGSSLVSEVGAGVRVDGQTVRALVSVRTLWANPDDVVAKLTAITPEDIASGRAGALAKPIADGAPDSPFARDYAAGYGGLGAPALVAGAFASIAIPAFQQYAAKSKEAATVTVP